MKPFYVYLLKCADRSYYCGHTDDIDRRMQQHQAGDIGYTSTRKPVELVWNGEFETRERAIAFEQQVKGWSRGKKEALIAGDWDRVVELSKSHAWTGSGPSINSGRSEPGPSTGSGQSERPSTSSGPSTGSGQSERPSTSSGPSTGSGQSERPSTSSGRMDWVVGAVLGSPGPIQRRALAKAITLLESTRVDHRRDADAMLTELLPHAGRSFRLGISGVPGVGKSTFIDALGLYLIAQGHRVAVLTIDPSSTVSGGAILGDKTRMEKLSVHERAYIRPSPSSGTLGGVAEKTREAMLVCEAAGYDIVIVETVGVGQSETAVAGMTDMLVLMQLPNAGDDLQAIKKGVMEVADLVVINKADLDADAATRAQAQVTSALRLFGQHGHPGHAPHDAEVWHPQVMQLSALKGEGLDRFWQAVSRFQVLQESSGRREERRRQQALAWMWERIDAGLKYAFRHNPGVQALLPRVLADVTDGRLPASVGARRLLDAWHPGTDTAPAPKPGPGPG